MTNPIAAMITAVRDYLGSWGTGDKALASLFGRGPTVSGINMTSATAMNISAVWACVQLIAGNIGSLPLMHYRRRGDRDREQANDTKLYRLLHDEPNTEMTSSTFFETLQKHVLLEGNAFAEISRDAAGRVASLYPIEPWRVSAVRQNGLAGELLYRIAQRDGRDAILTASEILHVPGLSDNGVWGISVIRHARESFGLTAATEQFSSTFFGKGSTFGGILSHPGSMTPANIDQLRSSLEARHQGVERAHQFIILQGGMKFEPLGIPGRDAQFLQCCAPGTLITMATGPRRPVEDLRPGDAVMAWNGAGLVSAKVAAVGRQSKSLVRIRTARGRELEASSDHPVLTLRRMRTPGGRAAARVDDWVPIGELTVGRYVRTALGTVTEGTGRVTFDEAYFLGAMVGDGYIRRGSCSFSNADADVIERVRQIARRLGGDLRQCDAYGWELHTGGKGRRGSEIRRLLNRSGLVGCHAWDKFVPFIVTTAGPAAWRGFLSGYLDTDGSVRDPRRLSQKPAMYWSSTSHRLLTDCQHLLALLGIQGAIYPTRGTQQPRQIVMGQTCDIRASWGLYVMGVSQLSRLAMALSPAHATKRDRLERCNDLPRSRYRDTNIDYDRVTSVEAVGDGETIGVEIADVHTHVTGGIITHNSRQFQTAEVARWFSVPPHMIGDIERSTSWGTGITAQTIGFLQFCLRRWLVKWEKELNRKLISPLERNLQFIEFVVDGLERGDQDSRYAAYAIGRQWGWLSVNDVRAYENLPKIEGGDLYLVPVNMTTPEKIEAAPPPGSVPPPERPQPKPEDDEPDDSEEDDTAERMREFRRDLDEIIEIGKRTLAKPDPAPADLAPVFDQLAALRTELILTVDTRNQQETAAIIEGLQAAQAALEARIAALPTPEPVDLDPIVEKVEREVEAQRAEHAAQLEAVRAEIEARIAAIPPPEPVDLTPITGAIEVVHAEQTERAAAMGEVWERMEVSQTAATAELRERLDAVEAARQAEETARKEQSARLAGMTPHLRDVIEDAVRRVVRVEADRARRAAATPDKLRAWMETFYLTREDAIVQHLLPSLRLHFHLLGRVDEAEGETRRIAHAHVEESRQALETLAGDAATLEANVKALTAHWEAERPKAVADECVREVIASA